MYKLLALDMDGTILTSQKTVSPATVKAINNLIKRGTAVRSAGLCWMMAL